MYIPVNYLRKLISDLREPEYFRVRAIDLEIVFVDIFYPFFICHNTNSLSRNAISFLL